MRATLQVLCGLCPPCPLCPSLLQSTFNLSAICWVPQVLEQRQEPRICLLAPPLSRDVTVNDILPRMKRDEGCHTFERLL